MKRDIALQPDPVFSRSLRQNVERKIYGYDSPEILKTLPETINGPKSFLGMDYTNNIGFRMKEDVYEKQPKEKRILFLGDSFTEGDSIDNSQRFYSLVQTEIQHITSSTEWRVLNGAIQGGAPSQYIIQLRDWLPKIKPDVVIVFFSPNDTNDDFDFENLNGYEFNNDGIPVSFRNKTAFWVLQKSYLLRYADVILRKAFKFDWRSLSPALSEQRPDSVSFMCAKDSISENWFKRKTGKYLLELKRMAESAGAQFGVFMIHYLWQFENEPSYTIDAKYTQALADGLDCAKNKSLRYRNFIVDFLEENGIRHYDSFDALFATKQSSPNIKLWNYYDYHFSPSGHKIIAKEVTNFLEESFLQN